MVSTNDRLGLVDAVDHLLNRGAVLTGEATISVAGVDLVYLGLKVLLSSVENLPQGGVMRSEDRAASGSPRIRLLSDQIGSLALPRPLVAPSRPPSRIDEGELATDRPEQGLARLVLTLVEILRQVVERQALHRMEGGSLSDEEVERIGESLRELAEKMEELLQAFGLRSDDLDIDLGPLGRLV